MSKVVAWLCGVRSAECGVRPAAPRAVLPTGPVRQWTADYQKLWVNFLASPAGTVLIERMRQVASTNAINGAQDVMHTAHSAGRTAGFYDALLWLDSQARIEFEQNIPISGADAAQSATSAQPSGEAALREHYSP